MDQTDLADYSLSPLQTFFAKVVVVTAAFLVTIYFLLSIVTSFATVQVQRLQNLRSDPAFWGAIENRFYALADAPDMAPEKKKKIVEAIHRLSLKYKPYIDAIGEDVPSDSPGHDRAGSTSNH